MVLVFILSIILSFSCASMQASDIPSSALPTFNSNSSQILSFKNIALTLTGFTIIALIVWYYKAKKEFKAIERKNQTNARSDDSFYDSLDAPRSHDVFLATGINNLILIQGNYNKKEYDAITSKILNKCLCIRLSESNYSIQFSVPFKKDLILKNCLHYRIKEDVIINDANLQLKDAFLRIPHGSQLQGVNNKLFIDDRSSFGIEDMRDMQRTNEKPKESSIQYTFTSQTDSNKVVTFETNGKVEWGSGDNIGTLFIKPPVK
jgi:hypothetical protein